VMRTEADIAAVLHRFTVPLSFVMALKTGDIVPLCGFRKYRTAISLIPGQPFQ